MNATLRAVLDAVIAGDPRGAVEVADSASDAALAAAGEGETLQLARAARGLAGAGAGEPAAASGDAPDHLADGWAALRTAPASPFTRYLFAEAALASGRLDLAASFARSVVPLDHPYEVVATLMRARLMVFRGRVAAAAEVLADCPAGPTPLLDLLVDATRILVRGNAAERSAVRALADRLERTLPEPADYLSAGCYLLAAFGLVAVGDVSRSARLALEAGGDAALARLATVDRALTYELLVAGAVLEADHDAADAWWTRAEPLLQSPIARPAVQRIGSRIALLRGDPGEAVRWADLATAAARADGRVVEAAEGEIVAARARIASSATAEAGARLEALVETADGTGHLAARRAAARELRAAGRRLRPTPGSEWAGLSTRERDVALMVAAGLANRDIAAELHLSEHTVRAHVARVLAAFGAASRFAVAARVAELRRSRANRSLPSRRARRPSPPASRAARGTPRSAANWASA
ncbi:MAG TPA: helix-turn-helix transcriptional regulator [Pseudolysinimonas sp.]|nr:helix-turn-helix transcriptional regulator [Pseudolysinimonas sp.]